MFTSIYIFYKYNNVIAEGCLIQFQCNEQKKKPTKIHIHNKIISSLNCGLTFNKYNALKEFSIESRKGKQ